MGPADDVVALLGERLRRGRRNGRWRQQDLGARAGVSQAMISRMELGGGGSIALDTWVNVAAAADLRFTADLLPQGPAHEPPLAGRRCHALIAETARAAGWTAVTEIADERIQTVLVRPELGEVAVVRVWDAIANIDAAIRDLFMAMAREREERGSDVRVGALVVALRTAENRRRVTESRSILQEAVPASGAAWMRALSHPRLAMPRDPGLLWADRDGARIKATPHRPGWQ